MNILAVASQRGHISKKGAKTGGRSFFYIDACPREPFFKSIYRRPGKSWKNPHGDAPGKLERLLAGFFFLPVRIIYDIAFALSLFSNHSCGKWLTLQKPNRFRMGPERYGEGWVDSFLCTSRQRFLFYGIYSVFLVFFSILYSVITIMAIYFFKWVFFFYLRPYTMYRFCDR